MGLRGRLPTPTAILRQRGSWRGKLNPNEPVPAPGAPRCPARLSPDAKAVWRRIVPQLEAMGVLGRIDGERLARYCEMLVLWWATMKFIREQGCEQIFADQKGAVQFSEFPHVRRLLILDERLARTEQAFGMDPSARSRLSVPQDHQDEKDNKEKFFKVV